MNEVLKMDIKAIKQEKFGEELYFLIMSSNLKDRIRWMADRYGLSGKSLRMGVISLARQLAIDRVNTHN
jgi:hypothetical protein